MQKNDKNKNTIMLKQKNTKSEKPSGIERRQQKRLPVKMLVDYRSKDGNYLFDFSYNLGCGGIFLKSKDPYPLNTVVKLIFTLPNTETTFEVEGKVMWQQPVMDAPDAPTPGMGVQFTGLTDEQRQILQEYLDQLEKPRMDASA